ncbi:MAG: ParB N-terminal domain-containing protein [Elusimicrobia bacterium]|nr:ParB N-terminal domain-containing protein [Elusimicrobiota bacterium]
MPAKLKKVRAKRKQKAGSKGLPAADCVSVDPKDVEAISAAVEAAGGKALASYRDPWGGKPALLAILPTASVEPTPFQRDLSDAHEKRLSVAIDKLGRYLDPIVAVPAPKGFYTPNGMHRLSAMKRLGAKSITALVLADPEVQYKILALNIEKAHSLKEKSLEVIRMYRAMAQASEGVEEDFGLEFEEPGFATLGVLYEADKRFAGGAYNPILKRVDGWLDLKLPAALKERERRAAKVRRLEDAVAGHVKALQAKGFKSPYLRAFVVARINPLRFMKTVPPFDESLDILIGKAERFDPGKVRQEDISAAAGAAD